jgi:hypothetical protein
MNTSASAMSMVSVRADQRGVRGGGAVCCCMLCEVKGLFSPRIERKKLFFHFKEMMRRQSLKTKLFLSHNDLLVAFPLCLSFARARGNE